MENRRRECFSAGSLLVWLADPPRRVVEVYTAPDQYVTLTEEQTLDGGDVLPGFKLPLRNLFSGVPQAPAGKKASKRPRGNSITALISIRRRHTVLPLLEVTAVT